MKPNILITWISAWIWNYLAENLKNEFNIYWVSRRNPDIENINFQSLDLTNFGKIDNYIESIKNIDFDALIFNAWVGFFDKIENMKDEEIYETINLNVISPIIFIKKLIPYLSKKTKIVFVWSVASKKFFKFWSVYQASKFALRGFAGCLKNEIKQSVFLINPRFVDTKEFFKNERIELQIKWWYTETKIESILNSIKDILNWVERRFEIDL
ncbi:MAG: oxidoreductase [uncultured bacterium (gcode 4)]|uniref:Oxidoreductase n=1 Tax=uncultured bacterium (gcode 4) TaxID=1234023 RepID=K2F661_9BACT|nr:MAG: oxidoreductase [uncultured bacterium (gcode 4)]